MPESSWKTLVRELRDPSCESAYLDRLRQRHDVWQAHEQLEKEIVREMASALGRSEDKLLAALARLESAGRELAGAGDEVERSRRADRFDALRAEALRARHELLIHREAVGIRRNGMLETLYPIPPRARR